MSFEQLLGSVYPRQVNTQPRSLGSIAAEHYFRIFDQLNNGSELFNEPWVLRTISKLEVRLDIGTVTAEKKRELGDALTQAHKSAQNAAMVHVYRKEDSRANYGNTPHVMTSSDVVLWMSLDNGLDSLALNQNTFTAEALLLLHAHHHGLQEFKQLCEVNKSELKDLALDVGNTSHQQLMSGYFSLAKDIQNSPRLIMAALGGLVTYLREEKAQVVPDFLKGIASKVYCTMVNVYLDSISSVGALIEDLRKFFQSPLRHTHHPYAPN